MSKSEFRQSFAVGDECALAIETTSGDVRVQGDEGSQVTVDSPDGPVIVRQEGNSLSISSPTAGTGDISVQVPRHCDLVLHLVSGDVELDNLAGQITVQTMSGDIKAERLTGDLRVHTVSGDISVRRAHLVALDVDSVSGDSLIESQLDQEGSYRLRDISGDLRLLLPASQRCTVYQNALSGEFHCGLPHEEKRQGWGKLEAAVNGGGVAFHVQSTSGDVSIEAAKELPEAVARQEPEQPVATAPEAPGRETRPLTPNESAAGTARAPFGLDQQVQQSEETKPSASAQRMEILKAIEQGRITVSEGLARLRELA